MLEKNLKKIIAIALSLLAIVSITQAQEYEISESDIYRSPIRKVLNYFSATITTGRARTHYKHSLSGFYYIKTSDGQQYLYEDNGTPPTEVFDGTSNWLNNPILSQSISPIIDLDVPFPPIDSPVNNPLLTGRPLILRADSLGLEYTGVGRGIPITLSLTFNYKNFRIGGGLMIERSRLKSLESNRSDLIPNYIPDFKTSYFKRYFVLLGYKFYDFWDYSFAGEVRIGKFNGGKNFNSPLISRGVNFSMGISIEKNLSQYFRVIFKPSYDFNSYTISIPGTGKSIKHRQPTMFYQVGISITFPEIPRSPIKSDGVQLKHVIRDPKTGGYKEVRGQPLYKIQNPKVGQNYKKMHRDKFKNRKKLNPY